MTLYLLMKWCKNSEKVMMVTGLSTHAKVLKIYLINLYRVFIKKSKDLILKWYFFFQAEDGIRDRSPSRGLGDVYKRQYKSRFLKLFGKREKSGNTEGEGEHDKNWKPNRCYIHGWNNKAPFGSKYIFLLVWILKRSIIYFLIEQIVKTFEFNEWNAQTIIEWRKSKRSVVQLRRQKFGSLVRK